MFAFAIHTVAKKVFISHTKITLDYKMSQQMAALLVKINAKFHLLPTLLT